MVVLGGNICQFCCRENTERTDFRTQNVVPLPLCRVLGGELSVSPGGVFLTNIFKVISVLAFLVADHWNISGFPPKTVCFLVSNLSGRRVGKVDRSFA